MAYRYTALLIVMLITFSACSSGKSQIQLSSEGSENTLTSEPISSEASYESSSQDTSSEPLSIENSEQLQQLREYGELLQEKANITSLYLSESTVDAKQLQHFLQAYKSGDSAVLELYDFSYWNYSYYKLEVEEGRIKNTGWKRAYGSKEPEEHWKVEDITFIDLLHNGDLFLRDAMQLGEDSSKKHNLNLRVYNPNVQNEFVQAYEKYFKALEFTGFLGETDWDAERVAGQWDFYFEQAYRQEHGITNIWKEYPTGAFPADIYESTIQKHFPIPSEHLRNQKASSYNPQTDCYQYEGGRGGFYYSLTRIIEIEERGDERLLTYTFDEGELTDSGFVYAYEMVDGREQIKRGAERYQLLIKRESDTFQYVSHRVLPS